MKGKHIIIIVFSGVILYLLLGLFLFFIQKSLIYHPNNQEFEDCVDFNDYEKMNYKGTRFYYKSGSQNVIVSYHGNARSSCDEAHLKPLFEPSGSSILFVEYAGYANDTRPPSMQLILSDARNMHDFIQEKSFQKVTVYGQSLGTGVASYHASLGGVNDLILISPFSSIVDLVQSKYLIYPFDIILTEKYDNVKWLKDFNGRTLILHGDSDPLIPDSFSRRLFLSIPSLQKEYVLVKNAGHNTILTSGIFMKELKEFLAPSHLSE